MINTRSPAGTPLNHGTPPPTFASVDFGRDGGFPRQVIVEVLAALAVGARRVVLALAAPVHLKQQRHTDSQY